MSGVEQKGGNEGVRKGGVQTEQERGQQHVDMDSPTTAACWSQDAKQWPGRHLAGVVARGRSHRCDAACRGPRCESSTRLSTAAGLGWAHAAASRLPPSRSLARLLWRAFHAACEGSRPMTSIRTDRDPDAQPESNFFFRLFDSVMSLHAWPCI